MDRSSFRSTVLAAFPPEHPHAQPSAAAIGPAKPTEIPDSDQDGPTDTDTVDTKPDSPRGHSQRFPSWTDVDQTLLSQLGLPSNAQKSTPSGLPGDVRETLPPRAFRASLDLAAPSVPVARPLRPLLMQDLGEDSFTAITSGSLFYFPHVRVPNPTGQAINAPAARPNQHSPPLRGLTSAAFATSSVVSDPHAVQGPPRRSLRTSIDVVVGQRLPYRLNYTPTLRPLAAIQTASDGVLRTSMDDDPLIAEGAAAATATATAHAIVDSNSQKTGLTATSSHPSGKPLTASASLPAFPINRGSAEIQRAEASSGVLIESNDNDPTGLGGSAATHLKSSSLLDPGLLRHLDSNSRAEDFLSMELFGGVTGLVDPAPMQPQPSDPTAGQVSSAAGNPTPQTFSQSLVLADEVTKLDLDGLQGRVGQC